MALLPMLYTAFRRNEFVQSIKYRVFINIRNLIFGILYLAARLFLTVEALRSLVCLAPDAYISTWTQNLPHIAR